MTSGGWLGQTSGPGWLCLLHCSVTFAAGAESRGVGGERGEERGGGERGWRQGDREGGGGGEVCSI
jgi:hypothetical protein